MQRQIIIQGSYADILYGEVKFQRVAGDISTNARIGVVVCGRTGEFSASRLALVDYITFHPRR